VKCIQFSFRRITLTYLDIYSLAVKRCTPVKLQVGLVGDEVYTVFLLLDQAKIT